MNLFRKSFPNKFQNITIQTDRKIKAKTYIFLLVPEGSKGTTAGSTTANITVQYTNSAGVAGRNTVSTAHIVSMPANRMYRVPLQAGDTGVKSIQSVTLSATTGTAGNFGVTLMRKIAVTGTAIANVPVVNDFAALGMPLVQNGTALNAIHQATTTSSGVILGVLTFIDG